MTGRKTILNCFWKRPNEAGLEVVEAVSALVERDALDFDVKLWFPGTGELALPAYNTAADRNHGWVQAAMDLRTVLNREGVAVIHCHDNASATLVASLALVGPVPPTVFSVHSEFPRRHPRKPLKDAVARLFTWAVDRSVAAVVAPSAHVRGLVISQGGFTPEKTLAVPYGVKAPPAPEEPEAGKGAVRVTLLPTPLPKGDRQAIQSYFLRAAQAVLKENRDVIFAVPCDRDDSQSLAATASLLGVAGKVEISAGLDLARAVSDADVLVLPTGDFLGIRPLLYAMAARKAVIAPNLRGVREFVDPQVTGLLVRPMDSQALTHAVLRLCASTSQRRKMAAAAAGAAGTGLSAVRMAGELIRLYDRVTTGQA